MFATMTILITDTPSQLVYPSAWAGCTLSETFHLLPLQTSLVTTADFTHVNWPLLSNQGAPLDVTLLLSLDDMTPQCSHE